MYYYNNNKWDSICLHVQHFYLSVDVLHKDHNSQTEGITTSRKITLSISQFSDYLYMFGLCNIFTSAGSGCTEDGTNWNIIRWYTLFLIEISCGTNWHKKYNSKNKLIVIFALNEDIITERAILKRHFWNTYILEKAQKREYGSTNMNATIIWYSPSQHGGSVTSTMSWWEKENDI